MTARAADAAQPYIPGKGGSAIARRAVFYGLVTIVSLIFFVPFIYTISTSFKTIPDSVNVTLIPHPWTTEAWHQVWTRSTFGARAGAQRGGRSARRAGGGSPACGRR